MGETKNPARFAAIQMNSQGDLEANLLRVRALVDQAAQAGASLAVLPENFAYFGDEEGRRNVAEDLDDGAGPIAKALGSIAREHAITIIGGGLPERSGDVTRPYNTCAVYGPDGALAARYRKIHLFDVELGDGATYRESATTTAGDGVVVVPIAGLNVGLSICYDLRFPELYRALASRGADVIVVPAAFTLVTGKDHWHVLLRARAIEDQAYVLAAAQWGKHPRGRQTYGKSCVIDPWGEVVAQASEGEGIVVAAIDREYLARVRASLPSLNHRVL
jgi:predicted amidohydrolase